MINKPIKIDKEPIILRNLTKFLITQFQLLYYRLLFLWLFWFFPIRVFKITSHHIIRFTTLFLTSLWGFSLVILSCGFFVFKISVKTLKDLFWTFKLIENILHNCFICVRILLVKFFNQLLGSIILGIYLQ